MDPELICVGDTFTTVDDVTDVGLDESGAGAMVFLNDEGGIVFEHLSL